MTSLEFSKTIHTFYISMHLNELLPIERYEIYINPNFDTAAWRYQDGRHQIVIGEKILLNKNLSESEQKFCLRSYLYHELGHSIWTVRDLANVSKELAGANYSFSLFNLFEDARIEEKMRKHTNKYFNWLKLEKLEKPNTHLEIFFYLIQAERRSEPLKALIKQLNAQEYELFKTVYEFYMRVLTCKDFNEVVVVMEGWYQMFPDSIEQLKMMDKKRCLFLQESAIVGDDDIFSSLIEGQNDILSNTKVLEHKKGISHGSFNTTKMSVGGTLLSPTPTDVPFDLQERDALLQQMQKIFVAQKRMESTRIPSKRINTKRLAANTDKIYKRKKHELTCKKNVCIVLDLSSSMGAVIKPMRLLLDVLNKMVKKNIMDAILILSGVSHTEGSMYEVLPMPLQDATIQHISPDYIAEGLEYTFSSNIDLLKRADYVWVFTDGMISDGPLDKKKYHRYGIKIHAFYIGDKIYAQAMQDSFDHVICESSVQALAERVFELVK